MPRERVLGSFIVRVVADLHQQLYTLQDLRTGKHQTFHSGQALLEAIDDASRPPFCREAER